MLTGEVVAYQTDGEFICPDCARRELGELTLAKAERGLTTSHDVSPIIRYTLDEYNSERVYEAARERVDEIADLLGVPYAVRRFWGSYPGRGDDPASVEQRQKYDHYHRLVDREVTRLEDVYSECCGSCGEAL